MMILCSAAYSALWLMLRPSHTYHCCHGFHTRSTRVSVVRILRDYKSKHKRERCIFTSNFPPRLQLDIKDSEYGEVQRKSRLLSSLKELYSCGQGAAAASMADRESLEPSSPSVQDQQLDQPMLVKSDIKYVCMCDLAGHMIYHKLRIFRC